MGLLRIGGGEIAFERLGAGPVIVFESGLGGDMSCWAKVARPLAGCARLVLYDRLGIGHSGPLRGTDALVGHSLGGFYVQAFARRYPQETAERSSRTRQAVRALLMGYLYVLTSGERRSQGNLDKGGEPHDRVAK